MKRIKNITLLEPRFEITLYFDTKLNCENFFQRIQNVVHDYNYFTNTSVYKPQGTKIQTLNN